VRKKPSLEHIATPHQQLPDLAHGDFTVLVVGDSDRHTWQCRADGAGPTRAGKGIRGIHPGFGHAVAFEYGVPGALLKFVEGLRQQRRRAAGEQPHRAALSLAECGLGQQARIVCRHAHEDTGLRQCREYCRDIELRQKNHFARIEQRHVTGDEQTMNVKDRQRVQQHVTATKAPGRVQRQTI
jgi:hypothetical protein